jgi:hypothetical protein
MWALWSQVQAQRHACRARGMYSQYYMLYARFPGQFVGQCPGESPVRLSLAYMVSDGSLFCLNI